MGTETRHRRIQGWLAAVPPALLWTVLTSAGGLAAPQPWWQVVGARGVAVSSVSVRGSEIAIVAGGRRLRSEDGGVTFDLAPTGSPPVKAEPTAWRIADGRVLHAGAGGAAVDPGSPDLGAGADLLAAPALGRGTVVAVSAGGTVWRRDRSGAWARALVLLPWTWWAGTPAITAATAFDGSGSDALYLGTAGYGVIESTDGGDDWVRADPGLPPTVLSLVADSRSRAVYAGTADGLWVHHLRTVPAPPAYSGGGLWPRQVATAAVALVVAMASLTWLYRRSPPRTPGELR